MIVPLGKTPQGISRGESPKKTVMSHMIFRSTPPPQQRKRLNWRFDAVMRHAIEGRCRRPFDCQLNPFGRFFLRLDNVDPALAEGEIVDFFRDSRGALIYEDPKKVSTRASVLPILLLGPMGIAVTGLHRDRGGGNSSARTDSVLVEVGSRLDSLAAMLLDRGEVGEGRGKVSISRVDWTDGAAMAEPLGAVVQYAEAPLIGSALSERSKRASRVLSPSASMRQEGSPRAAACSKPTVASGSDVLSCSPTLRGRPSIIPHPHLNIPGVAGERDFCGGGGSA